MMRLFPWPTRSACRSLLTMAASAGLLLGCLDEDERERRDFQRRQAQIQDSTSPRVAALREAASIANPLQRASFLIEESQPEAALEILRPLAAEAPDNVRVKLKMAQALAETLDVDAARVLLDECKQLEPGLPAVWVAACTLSYDTQKFLQAEEECSEAIRLTGARDDDYYARLNRGLARVVLGKLDGAYEDFQRCKQIDPENAEAYYDESWVWAARGDVVRTIENVRQAGQRNGYYASRAVVEGDQPYQAFADDPRWQAFLDDLNSSTPRFHIPALLRQEGIFGVPRDDDGGAGETDGADQEDELDAGSEGAGSGGSPSTEGPEASEGAEKADEEAGTAAPAPAGVEEP